MSACLDESYVAVARRIAILAGLVLRSFPTLATISQAIRLGRRNFIRVSGGLQMPSKAEDLLYLGKLLLEHYEVLRVERAPQDNRSLRAIQSRWIPIARSGVPELLSPSEFAYPTDIAKSKFANVLLFPPFGTDTEWASTNGVLFCGDHKLINATKLDDLLALISSKDRRFDSQNYELVYTVRKFVVETFPEAFDRIGVTELSALAVDCYSGLIALSESTSPRESVAEWRQRTGASLSRTIRIKCWDLLTPREQGLCRSAEYVDRARLTQRKGEKITLRYDGATEGKVTEAKASRGNFEFVVSGLLLALIYFLVVFKRLDTEVGAISAAVLIVFFIYVGFDWLRNISGSRQLELSERRDREPRSGPFRIAIFLSCAAALLIGTRIPTSGGWVGFGLLMASIGLVLCGVAEMVPEIWQLQKHGLRPPLREFLATPRWSVELLFGACVLGAADVIMERQVAETLPILGALVRVFDRTETFAIAVGVVYALLLFRRVSGQLANRRAILQHGLLQVLMTFVVVQIFFNVFKFEMPEEDNLQHAGSGSLRSAAVAPVAGIDQPELSATRPGGQEQPERECGCGDEKYDLVLVACIIPGTILFAIYLLWRLRLKRSQGRG